MTIVPAVVFILAVLLVAYTVAGYPIILSLLARNSRPIRKDDRLRTVSILIAAWNGEKFIAQKLESILNLNYPRELMQIIVVSDGSEDRTDEIVQSFENRGVTLLRVPRQGKPAALNAGIPLCENECLVLTDIRQELHPDSLRNLVASFGDPAVGAVSGEVCIRKGASREEADTRLYWRYEMWIRRNMSRLDSTFGTNGPFYALRRELAVPIPPDTLCDDVYLPLAGFFRGYRIVLEESAKVFDYPTSLNSEFKRKVRTQAGLYQSLRLMPQMLRSANRMRFHFVSAKFLRLTLPFAFIAILIASFGLPAPFRSVALGCQALFYGLALVDSWIPDNAPFKKITSPFRTFVTLLLAALFAVKVFFIPPRSLWKETIVRNPVPPRRSGSDVTK